MASFNILNYEHFHTLRDCFRRKIHIIDICCCLTFISSLWRVDNRGMPIREVLQ